MTIDFANNHLNGRSRWRADAFRDYPTSRTRVCVTVGMMTTGYDCEDVLNVVLARPIFSPTDFIQIKGRGTRLFTFQHGDSMATKDGFALFDFFANCEFFEDEFDYDRKIDLPKGPPTNTGGGGATTGGAGGTRPSTFTNTSPDPLAAVTHETVGDDGMKIDREMFRERFATQAREAAARHPQLHAAVETEDRIAVESLIQRLVFERPAEFWNLLKLRRLFQTDRQPGLREILQHVFGVLPRIPTREQLAAEQFDRFLGTQSADATKTRAYRQVFDALVLDGNLRQLIERGDFGQVRAIDAGLLQSLKTIGAEALQLLICYVRADVPLDSFTRAS